MVSEKFILLVNFQSRLVEEEIGILFRLTSKLYSLTQLEWEALYFGQHAYNVLVPGFL